MALEIELKLSLTPKAARSFIRHPLIAPHAPLRQHVVSTYFDTPDLVLQKQRIGVRLRKKGGQWLQTVKSAEPASGGLAMRSEWEWPAQPGQLDFSLLENELLRGQLTQHLPILTAVFTTDFQRQAWIVPFGDSEIEVALDQGYIETPGKQAALCEVELELVSGRISDIFALTRALQDSLGLHPALASKAERGYQLFLNQPATPTKAPLPALDSGTHPVVAFKKIALACLEHLQRNEQGAKLGEDGEYVHQARVALRRLRSAIQFFSPVLPKDFTKAYNRAWRTLAQALGKARDYDVFLQEALPPMSRLLPAGAGLARLHKEAERQCRQSRRNVANLLSLPEYSRILVEFTGAVVCLPEEADIDLNRLACRGLDKYARRAGELAQKCAVQQKEGAAFTDHAAQLHPLRIAFKRLRYALDALAPLFPAKRTARYLQHLERLQDVLGSVNDHRNAQAIIGKCQLAKAASPLLAAWFGGRLDCLQSQLPGLYTELAATPYPWAD